MTSISVNEAAARLNGKAHRNRVYCPGPGHSRNDRSLVVTFNSDGTFHVKSFAEDDFRECRDYVKRVLGIDDREPLPLTAPVYSLPTTGSARARIAMLGRLWESCVPIKGTLGEVYLRSRGISYDGDGWRYRPVGNKLVAIITDVVTGQPCGYHETLLDGEGRKVKRLMHGRAAGGCVRLYEHEPPFGLAIAEGIETALASDFRPVWACLSSSVMKGFPVLPGVEALTVLADHDRAGIDAANAVGERWHAEGREVVLTMPAEYGKDFADREVA
jgi:hypothetical protein